jgi:hypothetical protein
MAFRVRRQRHIMSDVFAGWSVIPHDILCGNEIFSRRGLRFGCRKKKTDEGVHDQIPMANPHATPPV